MMLDTSRHFHDAATVRRFIDLAALHKFNLFHWHLTDDQGWRLPIDGYPRLTEIAAWRDKTLIGRTSENEPPFDNTRHGGFFTHDEIRAIVAYAAARGVHILPEVDVPGHVQALVTAYPEFGNTGLAPGVRTIWGISDSTLNLEPATFEFLGKVVATLAGLFPFRYLHFGGDEAKTGEWAESSRIQEHKQKLGISTEWDVQNHFTERLHALVASHGRSMIGWDEIVEHGNPPVDTAAMYWRDGDHQWVIIKALQAGHPVVLANHKHTYLDAYQHPTGEPLAIGGHLTVEQIYPWEPLAEFPPELHHTIMGSQVQLWCEYIPNRRHLEYMAYPRACAMAQICWTGKERESLAAFATRLEEHLRRLDRLEVAYRPTHTSEAV
jgi:hexosaminidase